MTKEIANSQNSKSENRPFLPKVSVVIPIYNGEKDLPDLISCLHSQTYPHELVEYLLVDNCSKDHTAQIIQAEIKEAESSELIMCYLSEGKIQSSYAARNNGIRASTGEIIAFTDVDCRLKPDWLFNLIQPFVDSRVGLVGGGITSLKGDTLVEKFSERWGLLDHKGKLDLPFYPYAQTANLAVRRLAFEEVGLFRPFLTTGGDADICWRIQQQTSWQFYCQASAIIEHRHRSSIKGLISQFKRYGKSEKYLYELYDIDLDPYKWNLKNHLYQWLKWQLKWLPRYSFKIILGKATFLDLCVDPLKLIAKQAKEMGRREAQLSEDMRKIGWL